MHFLNLFFILVNFVWVDFFEIGVDILKVSFIVVILGSVDVRFHKVLFMFVEFSWDDKVLIEHSQLHTNRSSALLEFIELLKKIDGVNQEFEISFEKIIDFRELQSITGFFAVLLEFSICEIVQTSSSLFFQYHLTRFEKLQIIGFQVVITINNVLKNLQVAYEFDIEKSHNLVIVSQHGLTEVGIQSDLSLFHIHKFLVFSITEHTEKTFVIRIHLMSDIFNSFHQRNK